MQTEKPFSDIHKNYRKKKKSHKKTSKLETKIQSDFLDLYGIEQNPIADFDTTEEMEELFIPPFFQHNLIHGVPPPCITKLRDWQKKLLSKDEWKQKQSCVCVAPTSGGKTLIAECAIAQTLDDNPHAKIIYSLPFVALASEKYIDLEKRFHKFVVRPFFQNVGGSDFRIGSIAICTYEKAHSIINQAIVQNYINDIKLVIVDECHMIGDDNRGMVAEGLIMKLKTLQNKPQIIALTATLNTDDAKKMAKFVGGFEYISEVRTVPLRMFIAQQSTSINPTTKASERELVIYQLKNKNDGKDIDPSEIKPEEYLHRIMSYQQVRDDIQEIAINLTIPILKSPREQSILVFVNTRLDSKRVALAIAHHIESNNIILPNTENKKPLLEAVAMELRKSSNGNDVDNDLIFCVQHGIAFHHAGLLLDERKTIEKAAKEKLIHCIVSTTTLSAGVNITNVSRVIILQPFRYNNEFQKNEIISPAIFHQMAGRAGRTERQAGEVVVVSKNRREMNDTIDLMRKPLPDIQPSSSKDSVFSYMLQTMSVGITQNANELDTFLKTGFDESSNNHQYPLSSPHTSQSLNTPISTPQCSQANLLTQGLAISLGSTNIPSQLTQNSQKPEQRHAYENGINKLREMGLVEKNDLTPTKLGSAVTAANLTAEEGVFLHKMMKKLMKLACLTDELHMLTLCIPSNTQIRTPSLKEPIWEKIFSRHETPVRLITGLSKRELERVIINVYRGKILSKAEQQTFDIIYCSYILLKIISEHKIQQIADELGIDRGTVQALQNSAAARAGQAAKFAEVMGYTIINSSLTKIRKRLNFGVREELLDLLILPSCTKDMARILYDNGVTDASAICDMSVNEIIKIIKKAMIGEDEGVIVQTSKKLIDQAKKYISHLSLLQQFEDDVLEKLANAM